MAQDTTVATAAGPHGEGGRRRGEVDMLHGPLARKLVAFALPLAATSIVQQLFTMADGSVLGRFVGSEALAAVGATTPIVALYLDFLVGTSVGANVEVAMRIGRGDRGGIARSVRTAVTLSVAIGVILAVIGMAASRPLLRVTGAPGEVLDAASAYLATYCAGLPFVGVYNFGSAVMRSKGDSRTPLLVLAIACAANVALDLLLAVLLDLGVTGAALGTSLSNALAAGLTLRCLARQPEPFRLRLGGGVDGASLRVILRMGLPAGLQTAIFAVSNILIQWAINGFGPDAIAACAATWNYESFTYFMVSAFASAAVTFIGQNYTAGAYDRCRRVFWLCMAFGCGFAAALGILFASLSGVFLAAFTTSAGVLAFAIPRMWLVQALEFLPFLFEVPAGAMRGMGVSLLPTVITVVGSCLLRIVWVCTVFAASPTFLTLIAVYPISWVLTGAAMLAALAWVRRATLARQPRRA